MAALTLTSTQVNNGPVLGDRPGLNVKHVSHCWGKSGGGTTLSVSVCLQMIAIPDGARILDVVTEVIGTVITQGSYAIGDGSSTARYVTTTSLTNSRVVTRAATSTGIDWRYSLTTSGHAGLTFDTIDLTFGANVTSTLTLCVEMVAYYVMDRQNTGEV